MGKAFCLCLRDAGVLRINGEPAAKIVELHPDRNEGFVKRIAGEGVGGVKEGVIGLCEGFVGS